MSRLVAASFVVVVLGATAVFAQSHSSPPAAKPMDYDTFCRLPDAQTKREAFSTMTPAQRTAVVKTQIERWRDANKARLKADQVAHLAEMLALITDDTYADGPAGEASRQKARALTEKTSQLFTREDMSAMQPNAECIKKSTD